MDEASLASLTNKCKKINGELADLAKNREWGLLETLRITDLDWTREASGINDVQIDPWLRPLARSKCLSFFLENEPIREKAGITPSTQPMNEWATIFLNTCGILAKIERSIHMERLGLCSYSTKNREHIFSAIQEDYDYLDLLEEINNKEIILEESQNDIDSLLKKYPNLIGEMTKNISIYEEHYIKYSSNEFIEKYFQEKSLIYIRQFQGDLSLPLNSVIAGIPYVIYLNAISWIIAFAFRQILFSEIALTIHSSLNAINLFTIPINRDYFVRDLGQALKVPPEAASTIIEVLTTDRSCHSRFNEGRSVEIPLLIRDSKKSIILSLEGITNPINVLNSGLKFRHRKDWDSTVDLREIVFRSQLADLFKFPPGRFLASGDGIKIYKNKKLLTDIDAAILDTSTGDLAIFQLKWQDPFATSILERSSRVKNFSSAVQKWTSTIIEWIDTSENILGELRIPKEFCREKPTIWIFIVGRIGVEFSAIVRGNRAAYMSWNAFSRIAHETILYERPLKALFESGMAYRSLNVNHIKYSRETKTVELDGEKIQLPIFRLG